MRNINRVFIKFSSFFEKHRDRYIRNYLDKNESLRKIIDYCNKTSKSCGISLSDYVVLYEMIRRGRQRFVLECGTGKSTMIIAQAMLDNREKDGIDDIKLVSMDHNKEWQEHAVSIFPETFKSFAQILYSPIQVYGYSFIRGTVYEEVPNYPYELVFVDGPSQEGMCNMQFVKVVEKSEIPVSAVTDNRRNTVLAYSLLFGPDKVRYYMPWGLGVVNKVTRDDILFKDPLTMKTTIFDHVVPFRFGNPIGK